MSPVAVQLQRCSSFVCSSPKEIIFAQVKAKFLVQGMSFIDPSSMFINAQPSFQFALLGSPYFHLV